MNILGLSYLSHDTAAALIQDGCVVAIAEEERFTRKKHENAFPAQSIRFVLEEGKIRSDQVDILALPYMFFKNILLRSWYGIRNFRKCKTFLLKNVVSELLWAPIFKKKLLEEFAHSGLSLSDHCKIQLYEHHVSHAASIYFSSPFDSSLIISWDGRGEWPSGLYAIGEGETIRVIDECHFPNSIGQLYQAVTQYLGFSALGDEYKVMGLAPYGKPQYLDVFRDVLRVDGWRIKVNQNYMNYHIYSPLMADRVSTNFANTLGPNRKNGEPIDQRHMDIAASLQARVNEIGVKVATALRESFDEKENLCITGGVGQNIVMNQHIYQHSGFKNVFVGPASYDGGLSLGCALLAAYKTNDMAQRFTIQHASWGKYYSPEEIETELRNYDLPYHHIDNVEEVTARLISKGFVIGWLHGKAEFGPRALGNRSILADPRRPEMRDIVNQKIKFREEFRPFAPVVLEERFSDFFEAAPPSPYMSFSALVKEDKRSVIPAVTHVNGTARPQVISKEDNLRYWSVVHEFEKMTGCPVLLNTSFNVKGEPIVNSPSDAIRCFYSTGLDFLILEDYVVYKNNGEMLAKYIE